MVSLKTTDYKVHFVGKCVAESIAYFFVIILIFKFNEKVLMKLIKEDS